jgi:hypothetical protein
VKEKMKNNTYTIFIEYEISNKWDIGRLMSFLRKENKFKTIKRGFISK